MRVQKEKAYRRGELSSRLVLEALGERPVKKNLREGEGG